MRKELTPAEVSKLIKLCRKNGATSFEYGTLKVVFGESEPRQPLAPSLRQTKANEVQEKLVEKESLAASSMALDDDETQELLISDPSRHEQLLIEKELEDARSVSGSEDPQH